MKRFVTALVLIAAAVGTATAHDDKVTLVYEHTLPNVPGKSIKVFLVEYGPGGSSPAHTHAKSAFIYATVLEGAIKSAVNDDRSSPARRVKASPRCPATATA